MSERSTAKAGDLTGRVVFITGGAGGIGEAQARAAVRNGAQAVIIADRDADRGASVALELGPSASFTHVDVTSEASWRTALSSARSVAGRPVDVLMHSAGIIQAELLENFDVDDFRQVVEVNLTGFFLGLKAVVPEMVEAGGGTVVAISSVDALAAVPTFGPYAAAKAGILALVRAAAVELASRRIRVNAIAPGVIDTPMTRAHDDDREVLASFASQVPWGRVGKPSDIAEASVFLASDGADFVTGTTLTVDGGSMARISLSLDGWTMPASANR